MDNIVIIVLVEYIICSFAIIIVIFWNYIIKKKIKMLIKKYTLKEYNFIPL